MRCAPSNPPRYVLLETNEGDTPRIVVSLFSKSWADPRRGSVPVSWSINPVLAEQFPALYDYYASTAGANDSFISGPGGCGYVHFERMTDAQLNTFATRCGRLMHDYGPAVVEPCAASSASSLFAEATRLLRGIEMRAFISERGNSNQRRENQHELLSRAFRDSVSW